MATQDTLSKEQVTKSGTGDSLKFLWIGILLLLCYLLVYNFIENTEEDENATPIAEAPAFDFERWFDGFYQDKAEAYLKNDSKIGKQLLPLKNELDFKLYKKLNVEDYILGKRDFIIASNVVEAYLGRQRIDDKVIADKMRMAKIVQDSMKRKGIDLLIVFTPTKEYAMPELMPDVYSKYKKKTNNYEAYVAQAKANGLNMIDFAPFIQKLKQSYEYPIYPQYGTHPSYFTECMIADSVIKHIEKMRGVEMPHLSWDPKTVEYPAEPKVRDADAIGKARLLNIPPSLPLAYPQIGYAGSRNARPVKVLGVGDSYYRSFGYLGVMEYAFANGEYWYYYNTVNPVTPDKKEVWEYDLRSKIEENEVVILMYCAGNLHAFGSGAAEEDGTGFVEDAYLMYTNPAAYAAKRNKEVPYRQNLKQLHNDPELMEEAELDAKKKNISLDSAIRFKAHNM